MKKRIFKSVRGRLTLWYAVVVGLIFLVSDVILYRTFKMSQLDTIDNTLYAAAEEVELSIFKAPPEKWRETVKQVERGFLVNRLFIQLLEVATAPGEGDNFSILTRSGVLSGNISQREIWERLSHQLPAKPVYMDVNEESPGAHPLRLILYPITKQGDKSYLIQVGISLKKLSSTLRNFLIVLAVSGPVLLLISVLGGYFILTRALGPVQEVVKIARKISTENLGQRIESKNRKDEIGQLIFTFNRMISRLERSVNQIKQFSSDASHDLKTPLTIIRGEIEIALRKERMPEEYVKTLLNVQEEAKKLERVIDNLLFLSRIDTADHRPSFQDVPLDELLLNVFEKTQPLAAKKGIAYGIKKMETVSTRGAPLLLNRLVMNLLDNAVKYTPAGGQVEISLKSKGEKVLLTIRDTGIGIPGESLPYVFDRFYQVDKSRTQRSEGAGLGLAIVKQIADIHNATVEIHSQLDSGTTVSVLFNKKH